MHQEECRYQQRHGQDCHLQYAFKTMLQDAHLHEGHRIVPELLRHYFHVTRHQTYELSLPGSSSPDGLVKKLTNALTKPLRHKGSFRRLVYGHRVPSKSSDEWGPMDHLVYGANDDVLKMSPRELRRYTTYASDRLLAASPFICKVLNGTPTQDRFRFDPLTRPSASQISMLCAFDEDRLGRVGLDNPFCSGFDDESDEEETAYQRKRKSGSCLTVRSILIWVAIR